MNKNMVSAVIGGLIVISSIVFYFYKWSKEDIKSDGIKNDRTASVYRKITPQEAKVRMDEEKNLIVMDVREPSEYNEGHVKNAVLVPLGTIGLDTLQLIPDKNTEILVYCRSGRRSMEAAKKLGELGYTNVYDFGGINSWPYEKE